jgi:hypothetical protein
VDNGKKRKSAGSDEPEIVSGDLQSAKRQRWSGAEERQANFQPLILDDLVTPIFYISLLGY